MKITGTRSYILVEYDYRTVKISGELTLAPAFYAYVDSIYQWEPPYEKNTISEEEKQELIKKVMESNNPDFPIIFEL
ncbi:Imm74 family immunity protein [Flavihumibacter rivuli]|uniref:Imm74 family immunity protein n=1 Tax=Flavihumibacter rivuli TaxID=2838156 RepID=UPI001BDE9C94|nr:Imm74 family immunity protein [Flavihumibacter rivuli]ULQ57650.1 Imm74 family immunity protein [Flavihumibacter rivuli]